MNICLESNKITMKKNIDFIVPKYFKHFHRYMYNPVIFPGEDNGIIYIATADSVKLICHARVVFQEEGFFRGALLQRNGAWKSLGQVS